ncbi:MAG: DUF4976 domain-containing protein, partial [Opitutales bacterium]|nr:DUF4976 domain-containing protein [Opitutales bacterium]
FNFFTAHRIGPHRGIRDDRYKLIEYYSDEEYWEFFDLETDPNELKNRYGDSEYKDVIDRMTKQLRETQASYLDSDTWDSLAKPNYD